MSLPASRAALQRQLAAWTKELSTLNAIAASETQSYISCAHTWKIGRWCRSCPVIKTLLSGRATGCGSESGNLEVIQCPL